MISLQNVTFKYGRKLIFRDVNFKIKQGEFLFIVGESGIGKTTLMKLIYMENFPQTGNVTFDSYSSKTILKDDIPYLRRKLGVIFQDFKLIYDRNVYENIAIPLYISVEKAEAIRKKVYDAASKVGLLDKINQMPYDLSGGEQQRVAIARAMVNEPLVLLADEPTGNLDPFISLGIVKLLNEINLKGTTVIFATHNFEIVKKMRDKRIVQIKQKNIFEVKLKV